MARPIIIRQGLGVGKAMHKAVLNNLTVDDVEDLPVGMQDGIAYAS